MKFLQSPITTTYLHDGDEDAFSGVHFPGMSLSIIGACPTRPRGGGTGWMEGGTMRMYFHSTPGDSVDFGNYSRLCCREPFGRPMIVVAITTYIEPCAITVWRWKVDGAR